ncbi:MAG: hypothetical protein IT378_22575 [Sandaracinaceae bacterium]|nr:hypothetical protein [Sandaracinaceae bacterium]
MDTTRCVGTRAGALCALACLSVGWLAACAGRGESSGNLVANPGAEEGASTFDASPIDVPGWQVIDGASVVAYGSPDYPSSLHPGPPARGSSFFAGGASSDASALTQAIDVSDHAEAIDGGGVVCELSAYLGGWEAQNDAAYVAVGFYAGATDLGGRAMIGPVLAQHRGFLTGLLPRSTTTAVPPGTRTIVLGLGFARLEGTANDGYADDVSVVLHGI